MLEEGFLEDKELARTALSCHHACGPLLQGFLYQGKHDEVTNSTSTVKPVSGHKSTKRSVMTPRHVENDQTGTMKPVTVDQKRNTKLISVYQDCHSQLLRKQNISEFKSL